MNDHGTVTTADRENYARNGAGKFVRTLEGASRDGEACRLYARGWTIREISTHLGYGSPGNAHRGIKRALAETADTHGARELRAAQLAELDELRRTLWRIVDRPPVLTDRLGRAVEVPDEETGDLVRVPDVAQAVNAANALVRCQERMARLRGLDAPKKAMTITPDMIAERILELRRELGEAADPYLGEWDGTEDPAVSPAMIQGTAESAG